MAEDPYSTLGISRSASDEEIRSAYRKLAKELHPDLNPGDSRAEEQFKKISAAFRILGDPETRARFDRGEIDAAGQERPEHHFYKEYAGTNGRFRGSEFDDLSNFSDLFGDLFGRGGGRDSDFGLRGRDLRYRLDVEFLEAAVGAKKRIILPEGGTLDLNVPTGVADGQVLRLKGKGEKSLNGSASGDALIEITVLSHAYFDRDDDDILIDLPVTIGEAILGSKVEVPTITGRVSVTIPAGSSSGQILRLKGKGIKNSQTGHVGDQRVRLKIVMPEEIDEDLKDFVEKWQADNAYNPRRHF